ncbi:MAG: hypothetical protein ACD_75C01314G0001 [uncultured bacterium]|nr:MAG: hypothetical protein ACD_75C01314G0001 [uncultured bacterium]
MAEAHHLVIRFALGIEIGTALAAAHGERRQRILEHLLKRQEFNDPEIHRGMETQAALVRAKHAAHPHAKAPVDMNLALIVHPGNPEQDHPLRFGNPLQHGLLPVFQVAVQHRLDTFHHLFDRLMKFTLLRVLLLDPIDYRVHCILLVELYSGS